MYWGPSRQNSSIKTSFTSPQSEPKKIKKMKTSFNITHEMYEKNIITSISTSTHLSFQLAALSLSFIFLFHSHPRFVRRFACGYVEGSTLSRNCAVTIGSDGCLRGPMQKYWFGPTGFDCILDFHAPLGISCPF